MPDYEPDKWNDANTQRYDNCYDYATNNRTDHTPPLPAEDNLRDYSAPGWTKGVTAMRLRGFMEIPAGLVPLYEVSCEGLKRATMLDGPKEPAADGSCEANCWKIAYFIKDPAVPGGDFHFARQDSDGGWSHKQGNAPVTRVPDADPSDTTKPLPEKDGAISGYKYCGYLCCCPGTEVAMNAAPEPLEEGQALLSLHTETSGVPMVGLMYAAEETVEQTILGFVETLNVPWEDGVGKGTPVFGVKFAPAADGSDRGFALADSSVTVWDGGARHVPDPDATTVKKFNVWLNSSEAGC